MKTPKMSVRRDKIDYIIKVATKKGKIKCSHTCDQCFQPFLSSRVTAKYCSNGCKTQAYRERNGI